MNNLFSHIKFRFGGVSNRPLPKNETNLQYKTNGGSEWCSELSQRNLKHEQGFWFVLFCVHCAIQFLLMLRDWRRDIAQGCNSAAGNGTFSKNCWARPGSSQNFQGLSQAKL